MCHFGYRRHQAIRAQTITDGSITRLSRDFRTATYTVRDAVRHNDIQLLVPVRRRHCLRLCRLAVHKPGAASQIQLASLASCRLQPSGITSPAPLTPMRNRCRILFTNWLSLRRSTNETLAITGTALGSERAVGDREVTQWAVSVPGTGRSLLWWSSCCSVRSDCLMPRGRWANRCAYSSLKFMNCMPIRPTRWSPPRPRRALLCNPSQRSPQYPSNVGAELHLPRFGRVRRRGHPPAMNPDDDPETHESIVVGEYRGGPDGCPRRTGRFSATTS